MLYAIPLKNLEIWRPKDNLRHRISIMDSSLTIISVQDNFTVVYIILYRVDRLRGLQLTYQEQVEQLEQTQERQRLTAQRSLKKEMHSLQKRLLEDSVSPWHTFIMQLQKLWTVTFLLQQKQEVARIKKSLHTMLMQL